MAKEAAQKQEQYFQACLEEMSLQDLQAISFNQITLLSVIIPLPSVGMTNSYIDICHDFLNASYIAEALAGHAQKATAENIYDHEHYKEAIKITLEQPDTSIKEALANAHILLFSNQDSDDEFEYQNLLQEVSDYEEVIDTYNPKVPEIVECYLDNFIHGAIYELGLEDPDYYQTQIQSYPERQINFYRSPYSNRIGAESYVSQNSWLVSKEINLSHFLKSTGQAFRLEEFVSGSVFTLEGKSFIWTDEQIVYFPMNQYFKSRFCASLVLPGLYSWANATFTHSPYDELTRSAVPDYIDVPGPHNEIVSVHESGSLICVDDGQFLHLLYDTKPLNIHETKRVYDHVCALTENITAYIGLSDNITCDWKSLSDEEFESLCYDIIYIHPKFNPETIRKLGKSRSRDGGRDIIVYENKIKSGEKPKKWIFQCKLITDGSSLTGRKLMDVGDMLDQYEAEGFGVLTSSFIDSTLYDKLEKICQKRKVEELHFSVFELERYITRHPGIKNRYFNFKKPSAP